MSARNGRGADVGLSVKWLLKKLLRAGTDEDRFPCTVGALAALAASRIQRVVAVGYTAIGSFGVKSSQRQGCVSGRRAEPPANILGLSTQPDSMYDLHPRRTVCFSHNHFRSSSEVAKVGFGATAIRSKDF